MKILIIRFSSIGDIVLTSPVVRGLRKKFPSAEIHYLTRLSYKSLVEFNPYINKRHYLDHDLNLIIQNLRRERFDFIVDLHNNFRSWRVKASLRRKSAAFNKINIEKWVYVNLKWNIMPVAHIVDRYLDTVRVLGVRNDYEGLDYFISPDEEIRPEDLPLSHLHGYVAIAIGGNHNTKKLPADKLKMLAKQIPVPIILLGGKEDHTTGESVREVDPIKIFNGCGVFSINQSASLVKQSKYLITHDTGLMHIGAAFKKKIISVWGNTAPEFGMSPYYGTESLYLHHHRLAEVRGLGCRPCSKLGFRKCPLGHFKCMNNQDIKKISESVGSF